MALRVWEQRPLHEGDLLTRAQAEELLRASHLLAVRSQALALLARAEHSRYQLHGKLLARGREEGAVTEVLNELQRDGLLDDERFARSWVRHRLRRHPEGRSALVAGLRQRGVGAGTADSVVDAVLADEGISLEDEARELARKLLRAPNASPRTVTVRLLRRGFASSLVRRVMAEEASGAQEPEE